MSSSLLQGLALGWHSVDGILHITRPHRRARMVWVGIGIGWSLYWLLNGLVEKRAKEFTTIKEWNVNDR